MPKNTKQRDNSIVQIYDHYARLGVPNEVILRRFIQPQFNISRTTFYRILKRSGFDYGEK